ncbi:MAG: hypothetical protein OEU92_15480 [Alphaproteobacteria bacterium]|nr:hypothetical protein [Alphaproteobacteria bacterium]
MTVATTTSWNEQEAQKLVGQRVRLIKPMTGLQPGLMGTVTRAELIDHQWVVFVEWHLAIGEPYEDPFDRAEWHGYLDLWQI